jgi:hypothetical protein
MLDVLEPSTKGTPDSAQVHHGAAFERRCPCMGQGRKLLPCAGSSELDCRWLRDIGAYSQRTTDRCVVSAPVYVHLSCPYVPDDS